MGTARETITNWDRTQRWQPDRIHRPSRSVEGAAAIRTAAERGRRIKPVGGALSWSDAIDVPSEAIRFDRMAGITVDPDARRVTVQPGARLADVNDALAANGLAFDNFGSIVMQTAAGYVGTGSHGTGGHTPILAQMLTSMQLVDGTGDVHDLDATREPELFEAARVHLGCLGAVTELTFTCVEAFNLEERLEIRPFDDVLADLDRIVDDNDYLKLWWIPYNDTVQVWRFNRTDQPRSRTTFQGWLDSSGLSGTLFSGLLALSRALPRITPFLNRTIQRVSFRDRVRVDRSDRVIRYAGNIPRHQETEYAIPREQAAKAIDQVRQMVLDTRRYRVNFPMEIRFVAADDIPMSPTSERDSCYLGAYVASERWAKPYFADFEALIADYRGRPHWGKSFSRTAAELRDLYPRYDDFDRIRRRCDPHGVFRNSFVDRVFGLTPS
jgi:L-gulono-1,4-lactone dehydrogenase